MDIGEIKWARRKLETSIEDALIQFEEDTGTRVDDIRMDRAYAMGNEFGAIVGLKIDCSI